jgi:hypothetical protein
MEVSEAVGFCVGEHDINKLKRCGTGILEGIGVMDVEFRRGSWDELNVKGLFHDLVLWGERHRARNGKKQRTNHQDGANFARTGGALQDLKILPEMEDESGDGVEKVEVVPPRNPVLPRVELVKHGRKMAEDIRVFGATPAIRNNSRTV